MAPRSRTRRSAGVVPGSVQRRHVESRGHLALGEHVRHWCWRLQRAPLSKKFASWAQDDWQVADNLTLNLGLRYDLELGVFANDVAVPPFQEAGRPNDTNNIQPRVGFNYRLTDKTGFAAGRASTTAMPLAPISPSRPATRRSSSFSIRMTAGRTLRPTRPTDSRSPTTTRHRRGCARAIPASSTRGRRSAIPTRHPA